MVVVALGAALANGLSWGLGWRHGAPCGAATVVLRKRPGAG
jgi:hypothetical protein